MKIGIIVDNPLRDLNGCVILAYHLAEKGCEVLLIPLYEQEMHVRRFKPHLLILNYARVTNAELIKKYKKAGIKIAVLDTEGGVLQSVDKYLTDVVINSGAVDYIDYYFLWGRKQYESFKKRGLNSKFRLHLTGTPRYDYVKEPWQSIIEKPNVNFNTYILFLTSYPVVNPQFSTVEKEFKTTCDVLGMSEAEMKRRQGQLFRAFYGTIDLIKRLSKKFPKKCFVVRPHPFESIKIYEKEFEGCSNVAVRKEGNIADWIQYSECVMQLNSSSAIETEVSNKRSFALELLQGDDLVMPGSVKCSIGIKTENELYNVIELIEKKKFDNAFSEEKSRIRKNVKDIMYNWFYELDGKASERICDAIIANKEKIAGTKIRYDMFDLKYVKHVLKHFLRRVHNKYVKPSSWEKKKVKRFYVEQVQSKINRISEPDVKISSTSSNIFKAISFFDSKAVLLKRM